MKILNKIGIAILIYTFFCLWERNGVFSQTSISLENAYEKAVKNNLDLQSGQLKSNYQDKIKKSYLNIDPLNVSAELGQINSAYMDNKFSINQTIRLPKFYNTQKMVLEQEWKSANLNLELKKWQLKKEIALVYNQLNYIDAKENLIKKADSIYSNYYKRAELRLKKGESNILEKTTAENYRAQAQLQMKSIVSDRKIWINQFNYLINDGQQYQNEYKNFFDFAAPNIKTEFVGNSSLLKPIEHQKEIENARLQAEKAKLLPSFTIGISSGTIRGYGADEKLYDGSHRFQSGIVGIALPIFNTAQKSVIEGQKINQLIAENNYQWALLQQKNQYRQQLAEYYKIDEEQKYYKTKGLENAKTILNTANRLYSEGEINYLEWSILVNQSLEIQNKYIDNQKILNEKKIELQYLLGE